LKKIDRSQLSEGDRSLLNAAEAITQEMTAPPAIAGTDMRRPRQAAAPAVPPPAAPKEVAEGPEAPASADAAGTADLPPVEGVASERPATEAAAQPEPPPPAQAPASEQPATPLVAAAEPPAAPKADAADEAIADTKRKLDQIDQLLGASPQ
jgi:chemotaxis protein MotC